MAKKNEKQNDKEIIDKIDRNENVRVRFKTTYIGTLGIFHAGKEYDLDEVLYNLFKDEVEVI